MFDFKRFSKNGFSFTDSIYRYRAGDFFSVVHEDISEALLGWVLPAAPFGYHDRLMAVLERFKNRPGSPHPSILRLYDIDTMFSSSDRSTRIYIVTDFYEEEDCLKHQLEELAVSERQALDGLRALAAALDAQNASGLGYGNICDNTVLKQDKRWRLLHPAEAQLLACLDSAMSTGNSNWDYNFLAPEILLNEQKPDARSDLFSVSALLFYLLCGNKPYDSNSLFSLDRSLLGDLRPTDLRQYCPDVNEDFVEVLERSLLIDREQRYQSLNALLTDLREISAGRTPLLAAKATPADPAKPQKVSSDRHHKAKNNAKKNARAPRPRSEQFKKKQSPERRRRSPSATSQHRQLALEGNQDKSKNDRSTAYHMPVTILILLIVGMLGFGLWIVLQT